jgi:hypothetical protein
VQNVDTVLNAVILVAIAVWVGSEVFFSLIVAPVLFRVLSQYNAGRVICALFPQYYLIGIVCGLIAISSLIGLAIWRSMWSNTVTLELLLLSIMVLITIYARQSLLPRINLAREAGEAEKGRFRRLHWESVILNAVVLVLGLSALVLLARTVILPLI